MEKINKYQNGKIYKIVDNGYNKVYYGSTIQPLCNRMTKHRNNYNNNKNRCKVIEIFDTYGIKNCKIELVENYSCNSREELEAREGYYIKNNECVNKRIAGRSQKEYIEANKEVIYKRNKCYKEANKETIKAYHKQWYLKKKAEKQNNI